MGKLVFDSALGASLVLLLTLFAVGPTPEGMLLAARNTARFSSLVFALALLASAADASGSARLADFSAQASALAWAFVAAHLVHYSAVLAQALVNAQAREQLAVAAAGVHARSLFAHLRTARTCR